MGFNSVLMLLNDHLGAIAKDPVGWWRETEMHLGMVRSNAKDDGVYGFGSSANGFQVVWNDHMDCYGLILVGGNSATVVHAAHFGSGDYKRIELEMLKAAAEKHGYTLRKKSVPK